MHKPPLTQGGFSFGGVMKLLKNLYTRLFFKHYNTIKASFIQDHVEIHRLVFKVQENSLYVYERIDGISNVLRLIVPCAYLKTLEAEYEKTTAAR